MNVKDVSTEDLQLLFDGHNSISAILRQLNISETCPYNRKLLKERMDDIDLTKFEENKKIKSPFYNGIDHVLSDEDYFCLGEKRRTGTHIKNRLIKHCGWEEKCSECGQLPEHNGKPLSLAVDHINGNGFDNRKENLRFLCPNCHSQTETFGGKNSRRRGN